MFEVFPFVPRGVPRLGEGGRDPVMGEGAVTWHREQWRLGTASDGRGRATDTDTMVTSVRGLLCLQNGVREEQER